MNNLDDKHLPPPQDLNPGGLYGFCATTVIYIIFILLLKQFTVLILITPDSLARFECYPTNKTIVYIHGTLHTYM